MIDIEHPPYSPDLATIDFHLFGPLKKHLGDLYFKTDDEVQQAILMGLHNLAADFFYVSFYTTGANTLTTMVTV